VTFGVAPYGTGSPPLQRPTSPPADWNVAADNLSLTSDPASSAVDDPPIDLAEETALIDGIAANIKTIGFETSSDDVVSTAPSGSVGSESGGLDAFPLIENTSATFAASSASTLAAAQGGYSPSTYPYNDVVYIWDNLNGGTRLSGVTIGPHTVLTAAHGLWDSATGQQPSTIDVFPGYSGTIDPLSTGGQIPGAWTDHFYEINDNDGGTDSETKADISYDFGIIDFKNYTFSSWFGLSTNFTGGTISLTGFPASAGFLQTNDVGTVSADSSYAVLDYGSVSSSPGNSVVIAGVPSGSMKAHQETRSPLLSAWSRPVPGVLN
jgi:hypothetical protein